MESTLLKVGALVPTVVDQCIPTAAHHLVELIGRSGSRCYYTTNQTDTGLVLYLNGDYEGARSHGLALMRRFEKSNLFVTCSMADATYLRIDFPKLFAHTEHHQRAHDFGNNCWEIGSFLANKSSWSANLAFPHRVAYLDYALEQDYYRSTGGKRNLELLKKIADIELTDLGITDSRIGLNPLFAADFPNITTEIVSTIVNKALEKGVQYLVSAEPTTVALIQRYVDKVGLRLQCRHLVDLLAGK